jgi:hypothetical protein
MRHHPLRHFQQTVDAVLEQASNAAAMPAGRSTWPRPAQRERAPENELYDRACDLLLAAQDLRGAASHDGASAAIAPTIGCVEESLSVLAEAAGEVGVAALLELESEPEAKGDSVRVVGLFGQLRGALISSSSACRAAREGLGTALGQR